MEHFQVLWQAPNSLGITYNQDRILAEDLCMSPMSAVLHNTSNTQLTTAGDKNDPFISLNNCVFHCNNCACGNINQGEGGVSSKWPWAPGN